MHRITAFFRALTQTGQARLVLLLATAWIAVWGSVWGYSTYRYWHEEGFYQSDLKRAFKLSEGGKEAEASAVFDSMGYTLDRQLPLALWAERAKWIGPIGLIAILFVGIGGQWVYRGFQSPNPPDNKNVT